jgi:gamma-glutamyltranspeptidase/glutathione hydrolase
MSRGSTSTIVLFLLSMSTPVAFSAAPLPEPGTGVVATDSADASQCGAEVLEVGGNAADAAAAAALCAGVVQPAGSGLGGGGFAVVVGGPAGDGVVLDFREVAPSGGGRDMYVGSDEPLSREGGLAVAVPAESRGLAKLVSDYGRLDHKLVAKPAFLFAKKGFQAGPHLVHALERYPKPEVVTELGVDGRAASYGDWIRRPELSKVVARWASTEGEDLHTGVSAREIVSHVLASGGILTEEDLAGYEVRVREPIVVTFGEYTVTTMPPPSSGGVVLAQMLRVLEGEDLAALGHNSSAYLHRITETMKHAYADRAHHLGDPDFVDVPVARLLSDARIAEIRAAFDPDTTLQPEAYGELIAPPVDAGTQHISVLDADGMAVALTTTINTSFGSGVVPPSVGVVLNNEMDDFSIAPGVPNAYGLIGGEANAIAPGKRPLSSMTPTVIRDGDGDVVLVVGASGGSTIISSTFQTILNVLVFDMNPADAVAAARMHHQWQPDVLMLEAEVPEDVRAGLRARGHDITVRRAFSAVQAVEAGDDGVHFGASDPRKGGRPAGAW